MFRNALFVKTICGVTVYSFLLASLPQKASAWGLPPESFNKMYSLARNGDVEGLRASVYRGLNIDAVNRNGDTGLCVAAKRRESYTYNAFRAAGANPRHPCTLNIDGYEEFVANSRAVPVVANSREAYSAMGKEEYRVAPWVWWAGGGLLVGGIILALALGGGGGGGGGETEETEPYNSLGAYAGTNGSVIYRTTESKENSKLLRHNNDKTESIAKIDYNSNVLKYSEYLDVLLKATNGGSYKNKEDTLLQIGSGTIAMDAVKGSSVVNNGYINIGTDDYTSNMAATNASIGMVASETSTAINIGNDFSGNSETNGIDIRFAGTQENDTLIGMYADTNSTIINNGRIHGTAILDASGSSTALVGSLIGMEAMIINAGKTLNQDLITVDNNASGEISLSAGDGDPSAEKEVSMELVGMGSYLDYNFVNGSYSLNRAEKVSLNNSGNIKLGYTGKYTSSSSTALRQGLGGIVGMRADANTKATNSGNINLDLQDNGSGTSVDVGAGMQSVHGGEITNDGNISINSTAGNNRINYGMLSVEGTGKVSSLYTISRPLLTNNSDGTIKMEVSNGYGMASYNSGTLTNDGRIVLGKPGSTQYTKNIGIYANGVKTPYATLNNNGIIDIYSYDSMAMQNDFAGATPIANNGTINVYKSGVNSIIFGGAYSSAINEGIINYSATPTGDNLVPTEISSDASDPFLNYTPVVGISVMNTSPRTLGNTLVESSSTTEEIINETGAKINISEASFVGGMTVDTAQGEATNKGSITIDNRDVETVTNSVGMYLSADTKDSARITNSGTIKTDTDYSAAMASDSTGNGAMLNTGTIQTTFKRSIGMFASGRSVLRNRNLISIEGDKSTAIYLKGNANVKNEEDGVINVGKEDKPIDTGYGIFTTAESTAEVENAGEINVYTKNKGAGIYTLGTATAENSGRINVYTDKTDGIYVGGAAKVTNSGNINVGTSSKDVSGSYGIHVGKDSTDATVTNSGSIDLYNNPEGERGYAIYSEGNAEIKNENGAHINLHNENSGAIYAAHGSISNDAQIDVLNNNSLGLEIANDATATNESRGVIKVGSPDKSVSKSYGIVAADDETSGKINNKGTIHVYGDSTSYGVFAKGTVSVDNSGYITAFNDDGTAVYATGTNSVTNSSEIKALGNNGYGIRSNPDDNEKTLSVTNTQNGKIIIGAAGVSKNGGAAIDAKTVETILNKGKITVYNSNATGIKAVSGTSIENAGDIEIEGNGGVGINSGKTSKVKSTGSIKLANALSLDNAGILATSGDSIETEGTIDIGGMVGIGINSGEVKSVTNEAKITLANTGGNSIAIKSAKGDSLTNKGEINVNGLSGTGIKVTESMGTTSNEAKITLANSNGGSVAISVEGGDTLNNSGTITVNGLQGIAIESGTVSDIKNSGVLTLANTGNGESFGIKARSGTSLDNSEKGTITINGGKGTAISVTESMDSTKNAATINIDNTAGGSVGISVAVGDSLNNKGAITINGKDSIGIFSGTVSNVENSKDIKLANSTGNSVGIKSTSGSSLTNSGTLTLEGKNGNGIEITGSMDSLTNNGLINIANTDSSGSVGIKANSGSTFANTKDITIGGNSANGIELSGAWSSSINNSGKISLTNTSGGSVGIKAASGGAFTNDGEIDIKNKNGNGIEVTGSMDSLTNNGLINIANTDSSGSVGIKANSGSTFANTKDITIGGNSANGIELSGAWSSSINNSGKISLTNTSGGSVGIKAASGGAFTNDGEIDIKNKNGNGIEVTGSMDSLTNNGIINIANTDSSGSVGIKANNGSTFSNTKNITIGGGSSTGISLSGNWSSNIDNSADITLNNSGGGSKGIKTSNTTSINNSGNITLNNGGGNGIEAGVVNNGISNSGIISIADGAGSNGIVATGSTNITNESTGQIIMGTSSSSATNNYGLKTGSGTISNSGAVTMNASGYALYGGSGATLDNAGGTISLFKSNSYGLYAGSGTLTNSGIITALSDSSWGMYSGGSGSLTNSNNITMNGSNSYAMQSTGSVNLKNDGEITMNGSSNKAMVGGNSSVFTNSNKITISGANSRAMEGEGSSELNNSGTITVEGANSRAMVGGGNSQFTNSNSITMTGDGNYAMYSTGSGTFSNDGGTISMTGNNNIAIYAEGTATVENSGDIIIEGNNSYGIKASGGTIKNAGDITISGSHSYGIDAGTGASLVENTASITVGEDSWGIYAKNPSKVSNSGTITVGSGGYGMYIYVGGANQVVNIENTGTINISDEAKAIYVYKNYAQNYKDGYNIDDEAVRLWEPDATTINNTTTYCSLFNSDDEYCTSSDPSYGIEMSSGKWHKPNEADIGDFFGTLCKIWEERDGNGNCVEKSCPTGQRVDHETGECVEDEGTGTDEEGTGKFECADGKKVDDYRNCSDYDKSCEKTSNYSDPACLNSYWFECEEGTPKCYEGYKFAYGYGIEDPRVTNGTVKVCSGNIYVGKNDNCPNSNNSSNGDNSFSGGTSSGGNSSGGNSSGGNYSEYYQVDSNNNLISGSLAKFCLDNPNRCSQGTVGMEGCSDISEDDDCWTYNGDVYSNQPMSLMSVASSAGGKGVTLRLINRGTMNVNGDVDFGTTEDGTENVLAEGGQYVADSFTGQVTADSSLVEEGMEQTYTAEDAFVGENKGIEVKSNSYMFDASTSENENGNTDVVMSLKPFEETVDNESAADFLAANYTAKKGTTMFRSLKVMSTRSLLNSAVTQGLGLGILPNISTQNIENEHIINRTIDEDVIEPTDQEVRARVNVIHFRNQTDDRTYLTGYDDRTTATYGFIDTEADMNVRGGLGLAIARTYSKYNDHSSRYNNTMEMFAPFTYNRSTATVLFKPKFGFGDGHYRRRGLDKRYKGNTNEFYYGLDTLIRYTFDLGSDLELLPLGGVSFTGMYTDDYNESNGGLKVKAKNSLYTRSSLGMDIAKKFHIGEQQTIKLIVGGRYYHEFGKRYHSIATVDGMIGHYDVIDRRMQRDSGLMRVKTEYQNRQLTIGAEAAAPLKNSTDPYYMLNLGYWF